MKRRDFLRYSCYTTALMGTGSGLGLWTRNARAVTGSFQPTLINIMLLGGADFRYLFVPEPGTTYAEKFWTRRKALYNVGGDSYERYEGMLAALYDPATFAGDATGFYIHRNAGWLKEQFDLGNVAIIANVVGGTNRRHDHAQLIVHTGDYETGQFDDNSAGWGGRLAGAISQGANTVVAAGSIPVFARTANATNRNDLVVHAKDTRHFGLSSGDGNIDSANSVMARALRSYYAGKQAEAQRMPADWPFQKSFQHEQAARRFGEAFNRRLAEVAGQASVSASRDRLQALVTGNAMFNPGFGKQCANIYDGLLAADLFQLRCAYMDYGGWDHHKLLKNNFSPRIADLFGADKGLATLTQELANLGAGASTVFVVNTDFGRQLAANGDNGCDHGRGNYSIVVGEAVTGGVYGSMFPQSEIEGTPDQNSNHFDRPGSDIKGLTALENVLAELCDWVEPGTGQAVFPNARTALVEQDVFPGDLFA